jgi:hypothetical protein
MEVCSHTPLWGIVEIPNVIGFNGDPQGRDYVILPWEMKTAVAQK